MIDLEGTFGLPHTESVTILSELLHKSGNTRRFCKAMDRVTIRLKHLKDVDPKSRGWFEDQLRASLIVEMDQLDKDMAPSSLHGDGGFARNVTSIWFANCGVKRWERTREI